MSEKNVENAVKQTINKKKPEFEAWLNRPIWKDYEEEKNVGYKAWYVDEESGLRSIKSEITVNKPMKEVWEYLKKLENKTKYDPSLESCKQITKFDENYQLQYFKYKGLSFIISARDFYVAMYMNYQDNHAEFFGTNFLHENYGPIKGIERGICHYAGFILNKESESKTKLLYYTLADMKLSQMLVNTSLGKVAKQLIEIKKILEK